MLRVEFVSLFCFGAPILCVTFIVDSVKDESRAGTQITCKWAHWKRTNMSAALLVCVKGENHCSG